MISTQEERNPPALLAVVRIRGAPGIHGKLKETLRLLRLHKPNHATLVPSTTDYKGMLAKVRHLIAWGEPSVGTIVHLLKKRGKVKNGKPLNDTLIKETTNGKYQNIKEVAREIWEQKSLKPFDWIKPVFRLHPPSGGFENTKKSLQEGGSYGNWGKQIDDLLKRMI